jgi:hypothetical protein
MTSSASAARPITRDDIERKLRQLEGGVEDGKQAVASTLLAVGAAVAVGVVAVAYLWGRRRGKKKTTVVEVRRV